MDLGDVPSLRQVDGLQLFDRIHRHVHLASSFGVVTSADTINLKTHKHTQGTEITQTSGIRPHFDVAVKVDSKPL